MSPLPLRTVALLAVVVTALAQGKNPCHSNRWKSRENGCTSVQMPANFSSACALREPKQNGDFQNCASIYDLYAPGCKETFDSYVAMNPCDGVRAGYVAKWGQEEAMVQLDYFAYALGEQCCDNVVGGSKLEEYEWRNKAVPSGLWSLERGNGPAHFYYDIVGSVFPNFVYFYFGGERYDNWPPLKPLLKKWQNSPAAKNWVRNQNADIPWEIKRVLGQAMYALECHNYYTWSRCLNLESKQQRVR